MIFTSQMLHLTAVVLQQDAERVSAALLKLGVLHFVDARTVDSRVGEAPDAANAGTQRVRVADARRRIETVMQLGGLQPVFGQAAEPNAPEVDVEAVHRTLDRITARIDQTRGEQNRVQQQILRLEDLLLGIAPAGEERHAADQGRGSSLVEVHTGTVAAARRADLERELKRYPVVISAAPARGAYESLSVVAMKRNGAEIRALLGAHGFTAGALDAIGSPGERAANSEATLRQVREQLVELRAQQTALNRAVRETIIEAETQLRRDWHQLRLRELMLTMRTHFGGTAHAAVFAGWVPAESRPAIDSALTESTAGRCHTEWHTARELEAAGMHVQAPSQLRNARFLKPFEGLVTNYGIPAYGTVDPTPFVAPAYLIMFGLMFGDVGQGLVLVLVGLWGLRRNRTLAATGKRAGGLMGSVLALSRLIIWCGASAMVAGALFGSYFGMSLLPPLWFDYHGVVVGHPHGGPFNSILDVLVLTLYFGVAVIGCGFLINWINLVRTRRWFELVFDKAGVLAGSVYGGGIYAAGAFAASGFRVVPTGWPVLVFVVAPAVLFVLKGPLSGHGGSPAWWVMEWVIELLELLSGFLANTLSFMRVAGLGIAHVTLMVAFFQIAEMAAPNGFNAVALLIMIVGNVIVIILEGLSAGIQSLRLNYYEFFSKHFQPTGVRYQPVSMEVAS